MLIHVDPVRVWMYGASGTVIGMTLSTWLHSGSWEIALPTMILAGFAAWAGCLLATRKRYELMLDRDTLRAPVRIGWGVRPIRIPLADIDLAESRIRRWRPSVLKLRDGRKVVLPDNLYRPRDIRALFDEIERRVQTPA